MGLKSMLGIYEVFLFISFFENVMMGIGRVWGVCLSGCLYVLF